MAKPKEDTAQGAIEPTDVQVRLGRDGEPIPVKYAIGSTLEQLVGQYGEAVVASKAREKVIINLQDYLRNHLKRNPEANLQELADGWKPGMKAPGKTQAQKAQDLFAQLSEEERKAIFEKVGFSI